MNKYFIYMASGNSMRYGENKLFEKIEDKPLYFYGLDLLKQITSERQDCHVIVVSRYGKIREEAKKMDFQTVDCPKSVYGSSYTIKAGIRMIKHLKNDDYLVFMVADQPYLSKESILRLLEKADGFTTVARLYYGKRPGNPVLFSAKLAPELLLLQEDQGGGVVAKRYDCVPIYVQEELELKDIDRKEDLWKH